MDPSTNPLVKRVEEACLNGWPALREVVFDGWLIRLADGHTRRTNAVHLLSPGTQPLDRKIRYCEAIYAGQGQPAIFCIPSTADPALDRRLDERGYDAPEDESCALFMDFAETPPQMATEVNLEEGSAGEVWLATLARLHGQDEHAQKTHRKILESLSLPAVFAAVRHVGETPAAIAFGAVHDGLVCVNSVVTDPAFRGRGLAQKAVSAVLAWAEERCGATGACLSVVADNAPARALYARLGFTREMYRYHYRRRRV
ncbi:GNAT family N-acetyltransferase [Microvirga pakistanensis]|uniref:GNAT family N-acetyltransferase n=1 Tax=Microvirga pakistanensis TaxID=1682650 RepID=UPI00106D87ED|nr:GNAT family N-acetyltransferase [Microvirga pakistanensis]